jgi:AcrR family transcriptional regulator
MLESIMSFVRAHSPEQREVRRSAILETARAMLDEMPVADITLNGLSRRACMAKSNVLRYFESREAVLLELYAAATTEWVDALQQALTAGFDPAHPTSARADHLAKTVAATLAARPKLCDLITAQARVLEHNISTEAVLRFKGVGIANIERFSSLVSHQLPELGAHDAAWFTAMVGMLTESIWVHSHPPAAVRAAYETEPSLQPYCMEFTDALRESLDVVLAGLLSRQP